jgi:predicted Zn-dependent protease with MMP-like domain
MISVSYNQFQDIINTCLKDLSKERADTLKNVAILIEDLPSEQQRKELKLRNDQTLFGLYEGVPLSMRQGIRKILPDKITLFKLPIESSVNNMRELEHQIRHTLWHEIAHYYGLDHEAISKLE